MSKQQQKNIFAHFYHTYIYNRRNEMPRFRPLWIWLVIVCHGIIVHVIQLEFVFVNQQKWLLASGSINVSVCEWWRTHSVQFKTRHCIATTWCDTYNIVIMSTWDSKCATRGRAGAADIILECETRTYMYTLRTSNDTTAIAAEQHNRRWIIITKKKYIPCLRTNGWWWKNEKKSCRT